MSQYHQPGYYPTDYWIEDYWPAPGSAQPLIRTEPITYAPNSYYVKGYWADIYWPVAPVPSAVKDVYFRGMYRNKFRGMR